MDNQRIATELLKVAEYLNKGAEIDPDYRKGDRGSWFQGTKWYKGETRNLKKGDRVEWEIRIDDGPHKGKVRKEHGVVTRAWGDGITPQDEADIGKIVSKPPRLLDDGSIDTDDEATLPTSMLKKL